MAKTAPPQQSRTTLATLRRELESLTQEKQQLQHEVTAQLDAIGKSQAVIEFEMDGTIITANDNFLKALGYTLQEVQGKHHSMLVEPAMRASAAYKEFWQRLNRGEYLAGEYKRIGKDGNQVWIQGSYNPILDSDGTPRKVIKYATDVTDQKLRNADFEGQISAIRKSQAVIEFDMDGTIITANDHFLNVMGYTLEEVQGRHHRMFVEPEHRESATYQEFWAKLNRGEFAQGEYKRIGKGGKEVWIHGSYNPILDLKGRPCKVVKYSTNVTKRIELEQAAERQRIKTETLIHELIESAHQFAEGARVIAESSANLSDGADPSSIGRGDDRLCARNDRGHSSDFRTCRRLRRAGDANSVIGQRRQSNA